MSTARAQAAYAAYGESTGGKNFRGDPMPAWSELPEAIQNAWVAASAAAHVVVTADEVPRATLGRTVFYVLNEYDAEWIENNLPNAVPTQRNRAVAGQVYPAVVVAAFGSAVNLKVLLDGGTGQEYWATSRTWGTEPGTWHWPPRS